MNGNDYRLCVSHKESAITDYFISTSFSQTLNRSYCDQEVNLAVIVSVLLSELFDSFGKGRCLRCNCFQNSIHNSS